MPGEILKRKVQSGQYAQGEGGPGADRAWRLAFARAARDMIGLPVDFASLSISRLSLTELLELPPDNALFLVLEGPGDGLGLLMFSPPLLQGLVETLTMGRCTQLPVPTRKPTRTDAAMIAPLADLAMAHLENALEEEGDLVWTSEFRYASFIEEVRALGLLLEDVPYRVLHARLSLSLGLREGELWLVLPANGQGRKPQPKVRQGVGLGPKTAFTVDLAAQVGEAVCPLNAVLARQKLSLSQVVNLKPGMILTLADAALDGVRIEGGDGQLLVRGKLGQQRGMRAIRLAFDVDLSRSYRDDSRIKAEPEGPIPHPPPEAQEDAPRATGTDG